jgi:MazG family protein
VPSSRSKGAKSPKQKTSSKKHLSKSAGRQVLKLKDAPLNSSGKTVGQLFEDLVAVQARLRAPGGCPWDREQTHLTLRTYLIEEAYEVLDAIEKGDRLELAEELGDLLLQILFHADMAREDGAFDISNVVIGIHNKMIRRHPHVFGTVKARTSAEVLKNWSKLKAEEKRASEQGSPVRKSTTQSALDGVSRNLPALLEAFKLTRRAAQDGFDWENVQGTCEKLEEEIAELLAAIEGPDSGHIEEEVGDILFSVVNLARFLGFDPEVTLKHSNLKFKKRYQEMERQAVSCGKPLFELTKAQLEGLWVAAKEKLQRDGRPVPEQ